MLAGRPAGRACWKISIWPAIRPAKAMASGGRVFAAIVDMSTLQLRGYGNERRLFITPNQEMSSIKVTRMERREVTDDAFHVLCLQRESSIWGTAEYIFYT